MGPRVSLRQVRVARSGPACGTGATLVQWHHLSLYEGVEEVWEEVSLSGLLGAGLRADAGLAGKACKSEGPPFQHPSRPLDWICRRVGVSDCLVILTRRPQCGECRGG